MTSALSIMLGQRVVEDRAQDAALWASMWSQGVEPREGLVPWSRRMARRWGCSQREAREVCARVLERVEAAQARGVSRARGEGT